MRTTLSIAILASAVASTPLDVMSGGNLIGGNTMTQSFVETYPSGDKYTKILSENENFDETVKNQILFPEGGKPQLTHDETVKLMK